MKTLFIKASSLQKVNLNLFMFKDFPKPVGLVTTVQYEAQVKALSRKLKGSILIGSVLGCDVSKAEKAKVNSFLFVGTGEFHPLMIKMKTKKPVFVFNPFDSRLSGIDDSSVQALLRQKQLAKIKFLRSSTLGFLVSTKPGQEHLKQAFALSEKLAKKSYVFIDNTFDLDSLQDFNFVDCFVNTACPRLPEGSIVPLINIDDLG
ncbi:MAG: diphthamide synthesis protein [Candidatus Woesearchaeota archaeon]